MADSKDDLKQAALLFLSEDSWKKLSWSERQTAFRKLKAKLQEALPLAEICQEAKIFLSCSSCLNRILKEQCSLVSAESCGCSFVRAVKLISEKGPTDFLDKTPWIQSRSKTDEAEWRKKTAADELHRLLQEREEQIRNPVKPEKIESPVEVGPSAQVAAKHSQAADLMVKGKPRPSNFSPTVVSAYTLVPTPALEALLGQLEMKALPLRLTDRTHINRLLPADLAREVLNKLRVATIGSLLKIHPAVRRNFLQPHTYEIAKQILTGYGISF